MSAVVFLLVCFLSCSVSGEPQIQWITAERGDDVTLSCKAPNNVTIAAVEWIRPDPDRSDLDPDRYVCLKTDGHLNTADQDPSYVNRTQLKDDEMKNGELSLILKNVNTNDEGRYECRYIDERGHLIKLSSTVYLDVKDQQETAKPGQTVPLPCKAPNNAIIATVEWIRSDLNKRVFLKRDGNVDPADQDPSYVNRVQLKDDEMKNGDLSLILKNANNNDEGTYMCQYKEKGGGRRKRSVIDGKLINYIYLNVEGHTGGDSVGEDSGVTLPVTLNAVALVVAVGLVGLVGFVIYQKPKGRSENNSDLPVVDPDVLQPLQEN